MSLLDDVAEAALSSGPGGICSVGKLRETWSPEFQAEFDRTLASPHPTTAIAKVLLEKRGIEIRPDTLQRHRKRACRCA